MSSDGILTVIQLTDIHGVSDYLHEIGEELERADLIVLSGDITHFGHKEDARQIVETIEQYNKSLLAITGNCDYPDVENYLSEKDINLHLSVREFAGFALTGIGGSLPCPGRTPFEYSEEMAELWLKKLKNKLAADVPVLFISHQPPHQTINDKLPGGKHVGSKAIRKFIDKVQPICCNTGHIHEGIGTDFIGRTRIINPGPFRSGYYACVSISDISNVEVTLKQITASL